MAEMLNYQSTLNSITAARGSFHMQFSHYDPVPGQLSQKIIEQSRAEDASRAAKKKSSHKRHKRELATKRHKKHKKVQQSFCVFCAFLWHQIAWAFCGVTERAVVTPDFLASCAGVGRSVVQCPDRP
jgi:hypothetical protein